MTFPGFQGLPLQPGFGPPVQIAYAVTDVEAAASVWQAKFGAGPFVFRKHIELAEIQINGQPGSFDHSSAYGQWGDVMVELVQQHSRPLGAASGIHHCAFFVDDFGAAQQALVAAGFPEVLRARVAGSSTMFAFHDATTPLGHLVEIYEGSERLREFYAYIRSLAQ
jgi:catechol 2,3-dioxygenase-like lactoylglutathione lyase family enzyme